MPIGTAVRKLLGPLEPAATRFYRSRFIELNAVAATIASAAPDSLRVLEIGCGDGAMAAALRRALPRAAILGIDPGLSAPGRMYDAKREGVAFERSSTSDLIARGEAAFDLVMLVDVLHHVADDQRAQVIADAATLCGPTGTVAIKEWELSRGLSNRAAFVADRYVSGDSTVRFMPRPELDQLIVGGLPSWTLTCEARIPPRRANLLLTYRRT